jgi:hypothetical protein
MWELTWYKFAGRPRWPLVPAGRAPGGGGRSTVFARPRRTIAKFRHSSFSPPVPRSLARTPRGASADLCAHLFNSNLLDISFLDSGNFNTCVCISPPAFFFNRASHSSSSPPPRRSLVHSHAVRLAIRTPRLFDWNFSEYAFSWHWQCEIIRSCHPD